MARNTFIANINLQELKETYCGLGRLQGCDCCIAVRAYNNAEDKHPTSVAYVETSPFKPTKEVAEDIERTYKKLASFANAPHYKAMVLDFETFDVLAVVVVI